MKSMYDSPHEAAEDIRLVWSNCMKYNGPNTPYYLVAEKMSNKFEEEYAMYEAKWGQFELQEPVSEGNEEPVVADDQELAVVVADDKETVVAGDQEVDFGGNINTGFDADEDLDGEFVPQNPMIETAQRIKVNDFTYLQLREMLKGLGVPLKNNWTKQDMVRELNRRVPAIAGPHPIDSAASANDDDNDEDSPEGKNTAFPICLHKVVTDPATDDCIHWLTCGTRFLISNCNKFTNYVLPRFFGVKSASFTRKLKRWGFTRVPSGPFFGSYFNANFRRDEPELALSVLPAW